MGYLDLNTHRLHYRVDGGANGPGRPWLMFCNSLGTDLHMWDAQIPDLSQAFRILRYDRRGHGLSSAPSGPYTIEDLGQDALALMKSMNIDRVHYCGLSIGGLTAQWLSIHAADRLATLTVCSTASRIGTADSWIARIDAVREGGLMPLIPATAERWFSPAFLGENTAVTTEILKGFSATSPEAYIGCCAALATADLSGDLSKISTPLLAISGRDDPVCPPGDLRNIADQVQRGSHLSLPGRHIVNLESARAFNAALFDFLAA